MPGKPWAATVLTLYPEAFPGVLGVSVLGRGLKDGLWALETVDIRGFARDKHRSVDGPPAGGGPGMVMRPDVLAEGLDQIEQKWSAETGAKPPVLVMGARGRRFSQVRAKELAAGAGVVVVCGRFEGIDERFFEARDVEEVSVGDYVLAGGEAAAQIVIEACVRLIPGVVTEASTQEESFELGLLEYPQYTKPRTWEGREIPEVLRSGHHGDVDAWRRKQAEKVTKERRPDLWSNYKDQIENDDV